MAQAVTKALHGAAALGVSFCPSSWSHAPTQAGTCCSTHPACMRHLLVHHTSPHLFAVFCHDAPLVITPVHVQLESGRDVLDSVLTQLLKAINATLPALVHGLIHHSLLGVGGLTLLHLRYMCSTCTCRKLACVIRNVHVLVPSRYALRRGSDHERQAYLK